MEKRERVSREFEISKEFSRERESEAMGVWLTLITDPTTKA
jgi:hypothetical protein